MLARLGGDEFAIVLPRCDLDEARDVAAEAIATAIRERRARARRTSRRSPPASASRCSAPTGGLSFESVLSEADTAMYAAKDAGRDGVRVFDGTGVAALEAGSGRSAELPWPGGGTASPSRPGDA